MNHPIIPIAAQDGPSRERKRQAPKGRRVDAVALAEVQVLLGSLPRRRDLLIEHLHLIQDRYGCLSTAHLAALAQEMRLPQAEVFEVASFYHHFDIVREGEVAPPALTVRVCDGLSCELAGAGELLVRLPALLGPDVRVIAAPCIGRCDQAPAALVGQRAVGHATLDAIASAASAAPNPTALHPADAAAVRPGSGDHGAFGSAADVQAGAQSPAEAQSGTQALADALAGRAPGEARARTGAWREAGTGAGARAGAGALEVADAGEAAYVVLADYFAGGGYALLRECVAGVRDPEAVIAALEHSGLRGLGGAGFPAGRKWRIVRNEPGPRVMAVNIDEGEPGTFKDRYFLERDPHRFLEGMLIAAWAVGIDEIYIYLRDEYHDCRVMLQQKLMKLRAQPPIPRMPAIHLRRGAGAYICGEESAMIESIEGKRGLPRLRPPYVAQVGLFGRPTLEHNFETLFWIRDIIQRGPEWFAAQGRNGRKGLRSFSVSGRVKQPGVKLAPAGITVQELIDEYCGGMQDGHKLYAYLPGGASGGILPASMNNIPLDFDTLQAHGCFIGSAAVIVLSDHDKAANAARNMMRFFRDESCGQCTPCRVGTAKAVTLLEQPKWDTALLAELSQVMRDASICGLGQAAPNPVDSVIRYFPHEVAP
ncbi:NADH-ubiquinone oxidoreductase-F iron-sulfur binding region domain-containing protein [Pseudoduganella sp. RAF19]|uniref:NADH-ubiquinone oxidoreductase-F iron-sulfur binding region domain-containing protein n=1 Tax=Pseudoduganella sp. RAF19 TaxID=3233052 RepID=UPI003F96EAC6